MFFFQLKMSNHGQKEILYAVHNNTIKLWSDLKKYELTVDHQNNKNVDMFVWGRAKLLIV